MKSMKLSMIVIAILAAGAMAASTKEELQKRFAQRYPEIEALKSKGVIGETFGGYLEAVKSADGAEKLMSEENADRRELYQIIAKKEGVSAQLVAERNARRNFDKAKSGEYLKGQDGEWHRK